MPIQAVLFDLDGTLLDTAPDLLYALNELRKEEGLATLSLSTIMPAISYGAKAMLKCAFDIEENNPLFSQLRHRFIERYEKHLADSTRFFPHIEKVLNYLDQQQIPWGIVTNKLTKQTLALLKLLRFDHRPACTICGDTLKQHKPDPAPILYGCELLKQAPQDCLYIGDSITDVTASKAAGTKSLVALYGYISSADDPFTWQADGYIQDPQEIIRWL